MTVDAAKVCREAARIIYTQGLNKQSLGLAPGPRCMWGAIEQASQETGLDVKDGYYNDALSSELRKKVAKKFHIPPGEMIFPGATWNDADTTKAEDVSKFLLTVADEIELD